MGVISYESVIAGNFLQPLTLLVARLVARNRESVPGKTNEIELDWALPVILLTVVMFESYLGWVQRHGSTGVDTEKSAYSFYENLRQKFRELPDVTEAFILRDIVAHNHIWGVDFQWGESKDVLSISHIAGGDRKWERNIDKATGTTASGLHVIPTQIDRNDVRAVLSIVVTAMESLISLKLLLPQALSHVAVWPDGRRLSLRDLLAQIV
jgi:hypothetical protein